jgi:hypothetical protein
MAKTINKEIDIFTNYVKAKKAFDNSPVPCDFLSANGDYFIDRSKTAIKEWPALYKKIDEK